MVSVKNASDIEKMREAAKIAVAALDAVEAKIRAGMTTYEIDKIVNHTITSHGARPSFLGYGGFPGSACVSVNDEVIHGFPGPRKIEEGDVVSVDVGAYYKGFHSDTCYTFGVGQLSDEAKALLEDTRASLYEGIKAAQAGSRIGDIGHAVESYCRARGYGIVKSYCGHGIGKELHEDPEVQNYGRAGHGTRLVPGMTICIEPMITLRGDDVHLDSNGWTVLTDNGVISAHFEHEILITENGPEILTAR